MELFKVAPFDQNLCLNGIHLTDSSKTLAELKVMPKSLIYLRADEVNQDTQGQNGHHEVNGKHDAWAINHPEEGFKGKLKIHLN